MKDDSMASSCILLVEDDPDQANLYAGMLATAGYEIVAVHDAEEALVRLADGPFDLALIDWDLPRMSGDALITLIKAQYPGVKTILFSNHSEVNRKAASSGADAWMRKMEGIFRLRELIADLLSPA